MTPISSRRSPAVAQNQDSPISPSKPVIQPEAGLSSLLSSTFIRSTRGIGTPPAAATFANAMFGGDLLRRLGDLWPQGPEGDPPPAPRAWRTPWDGILPQIREGAESLFAGIREFFTDSPDTPPPPPTAIPPSVDQALASHWEFAKVSGAERETLWRDAISRLREAGHPHLPPETETYESFYARLEALGPNLPHRIRSLACALTLLHNQETLGEAPVEAPVAVVIGPAADHNGAFSTEVGYPLLDTMIASGRFHVLYFEASREEEARDALFAAYEGTGRRLHTLVIGGHGSSTTLAFGGEDPLSAITLEPEAEFLRPEDLIYGDLGDLDALLEPEGQILLWSCSNGLGGEHGFNMANGVAELAPGRRVYSTPIPSNISTLAFQDDLSIEMSWRDAQGYVAIHEEGGRSMWLRDPNKPQNLAPRATEQDRLVTLNSPS